MKTASMLQTEIEINAFGRIYSIRLSSIQYFNKRFFCIGEALDGSYSEKQFISTHGFEKLLMKHPDGSKFDFKKGVINPYMSDREDPIERESDTIRQKDISYSDIGPSEFSGRYVDVADIGEYRVDTVFETKEFVKPDFDLYRYQNDSEYCVDNRSKKKDREPKLVCCDSNEMYGKVKIIHGVSNTGDEFFDMESINYLLNRDIGHPEGKPTSIICGIVPVTVFRVMEFFKPKHIESLMNDCGNSYIVSKIDRKKSNRKQALRFLYEYFQCVNKITSERRKKTNLKFFGNSVKDSKESEFVIHFDKYDSFKIVYYTNVFVSERTGSLIDSTPGNSEFAISGRYDFNDKMVVYENFESKKDLLSCIEQRLSKSKSINLCKLIGQFLNPSIDFMPKVLNLPMIKNETGLIIYQIPIYENESIFGTGDYVNLQSFIKIFGMHNETLSRVLNDGIRSRVYEFFKFKFNIYRISNDYREELGEVGDCEIEKIMIPMNDAKQMLNVLAGKMDEKNRNWFLNANAFLMAFPDEMPYIDEFTKE